MNTEPTQYGVFAEFYDAVMESSAKKKIGYIQDIISAASPSAQTVLELGCGTGILMGGLSGRYTVSGVDHSPQMIHFAREKLPMAHLDIADIRFYNTDRRFDVVVCLFDTINHLLELSQWNELFKVAHTLLHTAGVLIFDFNTMEMLEKKVSEPTWVKGFDSNIMLMKVLKEQHLYRWDISIFKHQKENEFALYKESIYEIAFPISKIENLLLPYFSIKAVKNEDGSVWADAHKRPYYICQKKELAL